MPIYEYRCSACGYQNDFLQKISEPPLTDCPECGKSALAKQVTAAGFQLKGTGWYATDFKNKGASKPGAGKEAEKSEGGTKESAKTESGKTDSGSGDSGGSKAEAPAGGAGACAACT
jgi:putative FmdB family regulatory protein